MSIDFDEDAPSTETLFSDFVLDQCLTNAAKTVRDALCDQWKSLVANSPAPELITPTGELTVLPPLPPPPKDEVVDTIDGLARSLKEGVNLDAHKDNVQKLIAGQGSRAELMSQLVMAHDFDRLAKYVKARASLEDLMLQAAMSRELTPTQCIAFLKMIQEETEVIHARVRSGATSVKDVQGLLNKADFALQENEEKLKAKFAGTSPQGREIIRRLAWRLKKLAVADVASQTQVHDTD